jgi:hypothetical protein
MNKTIHENLKRIIATLESGFADLIAVTGQYEKEFDNLTEEDQMSDQGGTLEIDRNDLQDARQTLLDTINIISNCIREDAEPSAGSAPSAVLQSTAGSPLPNAQT